MARLSLAFLFSLLACTAAQASVRHYQSSLEDSRWAAAKSPLSCSLGHQIPLYGRASFVQEAGEELRFEVKVDHLPAVNREAAVLSVPPGWKHDMVPQYVGNIAFESPGRRFRGGPDLAVRLMAELESGMFPTLDYRDRDDEAAELMVAVSAVNFRPALEEFQRCVAGLLPYGFDAVKNTRVHFEFGKHRLTRDAKRELDRVAQYYKLDPNFDLLVDGHTDIIGSPRDNYFLSRSRANAVKDYLRAKGIPASRIAVRYHGEAKPEASNQTEEGRAQNRRVLVQLNL